METKKTKKTKYKTMIILLTMGIILLTGFLIYKEETTNQEAPKKAYFVENIVIWMETYG